MAGVGRVRVWARPRRRLGLGAANGLQPLAARQTCPGPRWASSAFLGAEVSVCGVYFRARSGVVARKGILGGGLPGARRAEGPPEGWEGSRGGLECWPGRRVAGLEVLLGQAAGTRRPAGGGGWDAGLVGSKLKAARCGLESSRVGARGVGVTPCIPCVVV